jgi:hypothetical protein
MAVTTLSRLGVPLLAREFFALKKFGWLGHAAPRRGCSAKKKHLSPGNPELTAK